jgi:phosphatidate cytidylyltransferase
VGDADSAPAPSSRAGRNLPAAIASGVVLAAVVILSLLFVKWIFALVVIATLLVAVHELVGAFQGVGIRIARTPVYAAGVGVPAAAYVWGMPALVAGTDLPSWPS